MDQNDDNEEQKGARIARLLNDPEHMQAVVLDYLWRRGAIHNHGRGLAAALADKLNLAERNVLPAVKALLEKGRIISIHDKALALLPGPVGAAETPWLSPVAEQYRPRPVPGPEEDQPEQGARARYVPGRLPTLSEARFRAIAEILSVLPGRRWNEATAHDINVAMPAELRLRHEGNLNTLLLRMQGCGYIEQVVRGRKREYLMLTDVGAGLLTGDQ